MRKTSNKTKMLAISSFALLFILAATIVTNAQPAITLTPSSAMPGDSVTVEGTGFGDTSAVGIGFGAEVAETSESVDVTGSGVGPWTGVLSYHPIKPGSFVLQSNTSGVVVDYTDNGDGTLYSESGYFVEGKINYTSGVWYRISTTDLSPYELIHHAWYTRYENNTTPIAGVTTSPAGSFSASITVPSVAYGEYDVTAVDDKGNFATSALPLNVIPEVLTIGVIVILLSVSVLIVPHFYRKWSKT